MQAPTINMINIATYEPKYQQGIEDLVLPIQNGEFGLNYPREQQGDLIDIRGVFQQGKGQFWVALSEDKVVGSVGVVDIGDDQLALKKMFVQKEFRGKPGVAAALLQTAKEHARTHGIKTILLGTVAHYHAAHRFYEKNQFIEVQTSELPPNFPIVHVDKKFYKCDL